MSGRYIWLLALVMPAQTIVPRIVWASGSNDSARSVDQSTSAIPGMYWLTGGVDVDSATMHKMIREHERRLVREKFEKGDVCGAAAEFNTQRHGVFDPIDHVLIEDMLNAFDTAPANVVMGCASDYAAVIKLIPGNGPSSFLLVEHGKHLLNSKNYVEAKKYFERAVRSNDKYAPWAMFYKAECDFNLTQYKHAADAYRTYYETFPEGPMVQRAKEQELLSQRMMKNQSSK